MDGVALQKHLLRLFERNGVKLDTDEDGWLTTDGDFPSVRAQWDAGTANEPGHLDIDVVLSEERCIEESFAGHGSGADACMTTLRAFGQCALHPLLTVCWYVTDERKLTYTAWEIGVRTWNVLAGPFTPHGAGITDLEVLEQVPAVIESALQREALTPELHWLRLVCRKTTEGEARCEVLLGNELWTAESKALATLAWSPHGDYSVHGLMLLDVCDY
ncbi:hypothetical protein IHE49_17880 [Rhodanobacter sp. 7MK24]|uniref:DUF6348 family protein n=1 Tax=Rhodanobacter sp. 7MK24 TaxID=2775922 RepID=UPI00177F0758|nr:DUF6348 family protein [Rhodanobacter sp. 7MK24]MBD8882354.1 hypothetical protein [Rhodanobacter sp. 7MK24]